MGGVIILPDNLRELIEVAQYRIHVAYHQKMQEFLGPSAMSLALSSPTAVELTSPPKPKRKHALRLLISEYAKELLAIELRHMPATDKETEDHACGQIATLVADRACKAGGIMKDLSRHMTEFELQSTVRLVLPPYLESHRDIIGSDLPKPPKTLGEQIRDLRAETKLSAAKLSKHVGFTERSVYRHENGKCQVRQKNLDAYREAFSTLLKRPIKFVNVPICD